ncbi:MULTISPECIES: hypothetical protein [Aeribacillus]|uniref:hypothetical protein n=1 Tax=Aeribacillus TaxID=1055323 RepID=UPI001F08167E|nr:MULTISPECIES: hypothetical protein [Aeribacillus]MED0714336.1 hypothetical protein [Aeribacillus composti]MED0745352.1 hypothetical protein [Aeribacillus composti]
MEHFGAISGSEIEGFNSTKRSPSASMLMGNVFNQKCKRFIFIKQLKKETTNKRLWFLFCLMTTKGMGEIFHGQTKG